ncbi:unnamed protein product, partial [Amoebophrya sp. A120]|eukprot:GSA120T00022762001.1
MCYEFSVDEMERKSLALQEKSIWKEKRLTEKVHNLEKVLAEKDEQFALVYNENDFLKKKAHPTAKQREEMLKQKLLQLEEAE